MENELSLSPITRLLEARDELRSHLALETLLMERICELPEDDFCHNAREAFSFGAGYALLSLENDCSEAGDTHVFAAFFETQPRNRYLDEITVRREQQALIYAALEESEPVQQSDGDHTIDQFKVAELRAFIEGYATTVTYLVSQDRMNKMPMPDLA